jgi:hypothetical protein
MVHPLAQLRDTATPIDAAFADHPQHAQPARYARLRSPHRSHAWTRSRTRRAPATSEPARSRGRRACPPYTRADEGESPCQPVHSWHAPDKPGRLVRTHGSARGRAQAAAGYVRRGLSSSLLSARASPRDAADSRNGRTASVRPARDWSCRAPGYGRRRWPAGRSCVRSLTHTAAATPTPHRRAGARLPATGRAARSRSGDRRRSCTARAWRSRRRARRRGDGDPSPAAS